MAGFGAGAEISDKGGAGAKNKSFWLRNTAVLSFLLAKILFKKDSWCLNGCERVEDGVVEHPDAAVLVAAHQLLNIQRVCS